MTEPIKTKVIKLKSAELTEYLRKVSQSIYNLRKIIDAHIMEPVGDDKDLNSFYLDEIDRLYTLLRNPVEQPVISGEYIRSNLSSSLMFNRGKTESAQKELNRADDCIRRVLGKVQSMRRKHYGTSIPTQGLEEGNLKDFLENFSRTKSGIKNVKEHEILIQNLIEEQEEDNDNTTTINSRIENRETILIIGTKEINIGSETNIASKLYECLSPLGTRKRIDLVFNETNPIKGKYADARDITQLKKEAIIRDRMKELQRKASQKGVNLFLKFDQRNNNVYMDMK